MNTTSIGLIQSGGIAPDVTWKDEMGRPIRCSELAAVRAVVLLFYRGAW
jgi:peroxiredoxin